LSNFGKVNILMVLMGKDCVFCKIIKGEIPSYKVYEDDKFLAFLDIKPLNRGHALVIPKKHTRWVYQVKDFSKYWEIVRDITNSIIVGLGADHVNYVTLGYAIHHAHIHIVPRYKGDGLGEFIDWSKDKQFTKEEMEKIAAKIKKAGVKLG
jgi:histidine triad (HIT) family protein